MKITGHRGAKDEWPENTILGMTKAIEAGVIALEIDVHKTLDNKLVVIHDPTMDRTTDLTGKVSELTCDEVRKADAGKGEKVPTLEEVLELSLSKDIQLFIEAKAFNIEKELIEILEKKQAFDKTYIISFDHRLIQDLTSIDERVRGGCLMVAAPVDPLSILDSAGAGLLAISTDTVDEKIVSLCHSSGKKVAVWNANSLEHYKQMNDIGADFIMTDRPCQICPLV